jgi:hypothetical protein
MVVLHALHSPFARWPRTLPKDAHALLHQPRRSAAPAAADLQSYNLLVISMPARTISGIHGEACLFSQLGPSERYILP